MHSYLYECACYMYSHNCTIPNPTTSCVRLKTLFPLVHPLSCRAQLYSGCGCNVRSSCGLDGEICPLQEGKVLDMTLPAVPRGRTPCLAASGVKEHSHISEVQASSQDCVFYSLYSVPLYVTNQDKTPKIPGHTILSHYYA